MSIGEALVTSGDTASCGSDLFAQFAVGTLQCTTLSDGFIETPPWILAPEVPTAELGSFLAEHGEDITALKTPITCLFIELPNGRRLLIDSGLGSVPGPGGHAVATAGRLQSALAAAGIAHDSIDDVLVSHVHPDHIGGFFDGEGNPRFSRAVYHVPREDAVFWNQAKPDLSGTLMPPPLQGGTVQTAQRFMSFAAATGRLKLFEAGRDVMDGVGSMLLPGHTPGQVGFVIHGGSDTLFYMAYAAGHPAISVKKPEWRFAFDVDPLLAIETRKKLIALLADKGWTTFTPHFPWPGVGRMVRTENAIEWKPKC
jgi:glyoxylase-like metal-dependent hydrolase (beta-lactamase superfamily II)